MSLLELKASVTLAWLETLGLSAPVYTNRLRVTCTASPKKFKETLLVVICNTAEETNIATPYWHYQYWVPHIRVTWVLVSWMLVAWVPQRAGYQQSDHQIIAVLLDVGSRSDLELSLALDGALRPETCRRIGRTKLLKQHLHQWLALVIYGASYEAYYTLGVCWCLWNSMRAPCNQVSVFWRTVLNDGRHTMPSSLNQVDTCICN